MYTYIHIMVCILHIGVWYCCKTCQKQDWKRAHKLSCLRTKQLIIAGEFSERAAVGRLVRKIRLYALPFFIANETTATMHQKKKQASSKPQKGKVDDDDDDDDDDELSGVLFVQTMNSLNEFALMEATVNPLNHSRYSRMAILNYLSLKEFQEMAFSMAKTQSKNTDERQVSAESEQAATDKKEDDGDDRLPTDLLSLYPLLKETVHQMDPDQEVVVVVKFKCNAIHLLKIPYVPSKSICNALSIDYRNKACLQLNLEEE